MLNTQSNFKVHQEDEQLALHNFKGLFSVQSIINSSPLKEHNTNHRNKLLQSKAPKQQNLRTTFHDWIL
jgi:hypothetical protein